MPDEPQDTPANDTPEGEAQPDTLEFARQKLLRARQEAEERSPEVIFNFALGALVELDIAAEVAAGKTRVSGDQEGHLLAVQLQEILAAASRMIQGHLGYEPHPKCSSKEDGASKAQLAKAASDYLTTLALGRPHKLAKKQKEATRIVGLVRERMQAAGPGHHPGTYAHAAHQALLDYANGIFANYHLAAMVAPPIAAAIIRLPPPTEEALRRAVAEATLAIDQGRLSKTGEEAARRAIVAILRCWGVPAKDANNWFRPTR